MLVSKIINTAKHVLQFYIDSQQIPIVDKFLHFGHTTVSHIDDDKEISTERNELCGKINNCVTSSDATLCYHLKEPLLMFI